MRRNESEGITGLVVQRQENERDVSLEAATVTTVEHPMSSLALTFTTQEINS